MNALLWLLQIVTALLFFASGVMKAFMFDRVSVGVPSFGALPREVWMALGVLELVFVGVHVKYDETGPIIMSAALGIVMAFIAYGRKILRPIRKAPDITD